MVLSRYPEYSKRGQKAYYPAGYQDWLDDATMILRSVGRGLKVSPGEKVTLRIVLGPDWFEVDIRPLGDVSMRHGLRGDVDNYAKAVMDAVAAAGLVTNDRQVEHLSVSFASGEDAE